MWYHPLSRKKIREKNGKCNQYDILLVLPKSFWTTFKIIFKALSALGACHVTVIGGVVYKKSMIFKVFGVYLSEFLIFLHEIFLGSKILPSSCNKHQNFDYGCSRYPRNEAQSPDFGHFYDFGHFSTSPFLISIYLEQKMFTKN